ncbi:hypothetical protein CBS101457_005267 [Exobasidium rhododendri]|nr:hypothetical protein CBS101457_005267 [Exobasidium rhododendri]
MSVASRNPFALLGDEDSSAVSAAAPAAKVEQAAPKRTIPGAQVNNASRGGAAATPRGGRGGARGGRAGAEGGAGGDEDAPQRENRGSTRGAARGRGEGRGGARGARGAPRGRGRAFDRHSQTGKEDSAKNIHQGWGGDDPKRELDVEDGARADAAEEGATPAGDKSTPVNGEAAAGGEAKEALPIVEEEVDNTKTLDEYLAEQATKRAQIGAKKEARSADVVDPDTLGKRLEKQDAEEYFKIEKERQVRQREKKEKQVLQIEQSFNAPPAPARGGSERGRGGGRGGDRGRGGARGRGDRGRGAPRGAPRGRGISSGGGANLNLSDDSAFPTLG